MLSGKELFEIVGEDRAEDDPDQLSVGGFESAAEKDGPLPVVRLFCGRLMNVFGGRGQQHLDEVPIAAIDVRGRPTAREVDQIAVRVVQRERRDVGQAGDPAAPGPGGPRTTSSLA